MNYVSAELVRTQLFMRYQFVTETVQVTTMTTTIKQAIYPLLLTGFVLGLGVYSPNKSYLSIFYNLIVWIAYGYLYYYIVTTLKAEDWFTSIFGIITLQISILTSIVSIVISIYQDKRFRMFMKKLAAVDNTLEEMGSPKTYRKLHACARGVLVGWFVCSNAANIIDMIWWSYVVDHMNWCLIISYVTNHHEHFNVFVDLLFVTFLWYIGTRFDKVNEHMKCLLVKEEYGLRFTWRKTVLVTRDTRYIMCTNYYKRVLWISMHLHLELCQIARELNTMFGVQMTMKMIEYLIFLTRLCYYIFIHIQTRGRLMFSSINWLDLYFWISFYLLRLFCLNYICESVSAKSNQVERIIHQLTDHLRYADVRDEIYQFTLQVLQHPLKFTGLGFFYFGNNFLQKFFVTIATFVIIIMQMSTIPDVYTGF